MYVAFSVKALLYVAFSIKALYSHTLAFLPAKNRRKKEKKKEKKKERGLRRKTSRCNGQNSKIKKNCVVQETVLKVSKNNLPFQKLE